MYWYRTVPYNNYLKKKKDVYYSTLVVRTLPVRTFLQRSTYGIIQTCVEIQSHSHSIKCIVHIYVRTYDKHVVVQKSHFKMAL